MNPTHTETRPLAALGYADYSEVKVAIDRAEALNPNDYVDFSGVTDAIGDVIWNLDSEQQGSVDAMADAINSAIDALVPKPDTPPVDPDDNQPIYPPWGNDEDYIPIPSTIIKEEGENDDIRLFIVLGSVAASLFFLFVIFDRKEKNR